MTEKYIIARKITSFKINKVAFSGFSSTNLNKVLA